MTRGPNYEFQEWWNKQRERNPEQHFLDESTITTTSNTRTNNNNSSHSVEIRSPDNSHSDQAFEKDRSRTARQLSWVFRLKFQQIFASIAFVTNGLISILRIANRRIVSSDSPADSSSSRLYRVIKGFLAVVLLLLCFELVAYFNGWHFSPPSLHSSDVLSFLELIYANWLKIRANYLAPPLQSLTNICIVLFLVQSVDRVVMVLGCFWIKFWRIKPKPVMNYKSGTSVEQDGNFNLLDYPMVLVQIPMCNEREVRRCRSRIPNTLHFALFDYLPFVGCCHGGAYSILLLDLDLIYYLSYWVPKHYSISCLN